MVDAMPRYALTTLGDTGAGRTVRIEAADTDPAFVDESRPILLQAKSFDATEAVSWFIRSLPQGTAWLRRESRGASTLSTLPITGMPGVKTALSACSNMKREVHPDWFCVDVFYGDENLPELCMLDGELAVRLHKAVASGELTLKFDDAPAPKRRPKP